MITRSLAWATTILVCTSGSTMAQKSTTAAKPTPADGFTIHVTAPHMISGHAMGPVHHWCKPVSPEPIIVCLLTDTSDPNSPLTGVEYIVSKKITRPLVTLGTWNANFHDHKDEIATGRVQVLDMPPEEARKVADLVATTDGIIFHLWPAGDRIPTGSVEIGQAVGHRPLSKAEYGAAVSTQ